MRGSPTVQWRDVEAKEDSRGVFVVWDAGSFEVHYETYHYGKKGMCDRGL